MSERIDSPPAAGAAVRRFGRFELRQLLGRSTRTMLWRAFDSRSAQPVLLALPRSQPPDAAALRRWLDEARRAARLLHPALAPVVDSGAQEQWPYVAVDGALGLTVPEWLAAHGEPAHADAAHWLGDVLQALAYAHDAGFVHGDLQPWMVLVGETGRVRLLGLGTVASPPDDPHARRDAAEADVLAAGVVLHGLLAGKPPLDEADVGRVLERLAPHGRDALRLPRLTPLPLAAALRAIADRATSTQLRLRYRNARTLQLALDGWREAHDNAEGGPIARLLERVETAGHLPALPGVVARAARLASMERGRVQEMAASVLDDLALSLELLRQANGPQAQSLRALGSAPVLTVRRAIAMIGVDGVRHAASGLRGWPGPLGAPAAAELQALYGRVRLAGQVARRIRPAGFDGEVVYLVAVLQNLGRLLVQYHFADEAAQMRLLMQPAPGAADGETVHPGLAEADAACAVLGAELDAFAAALVRQWALGEQMAQLMRRLNPAMPVRSGERDDEMIRAAASCANEAVDALALPQPRQTAALERVAQRYVRMLGLTLRDLQDALRGAPAEAAA
jgi:HD-like signal output (HDOD) protein